jgi:hypothetical protein
LGGGRGGGPATAAGSVFGSTMGAPWGGGGMGGRPEDMLLLHGVVPRPCSIQLQQLNSQVKGLRKIGQGAGKEDACARTMRACNSSRGTLMHACVVVHATSPSIRHPCSNTSCTHAHMRT